MKVYLDNAASTKVKDCVLDKFVEVAKNTFGNPSSEHTEGYLADNCIEMVKENIAKKIHFVQKQFQQFLLLNIFKDLKNIQILKIQL